MHALLKLYAEDEGAFQIRAIPVGSSAKRIVDISLAIGAVVLLCPVLISCLVVVTIATKGSPIFSHQRIGFRGKRFGCLKFRTMVPNADEQLCDAFARNPEAKREWEENQKLRDDPRVTALGAVLRRYSLDELPQLLNVLKGDMSMVGPRPVTESEIARYANAANAYLACRPGITGLWQVNGRSSTSFDKRVEYDLMYAERWSLMGDVKILLLTIPAVLDSRSAC